MTSEEVAKLTGLSSSRVRQAAPKYAEKHGKFWWWSEEGVVQLKERIGQRGDKLSDKESSLFFKCGNEFYECTVDKMEQSYLANIKFPQGTFTFVCPFITNFLDILEQRKRAFSEIQEKLESQLLQNSPSDEREGV